MKLILRTKVAEKFLPLYLKACQFCNIDFVEQYLQLFAVLFKQHIHKAKNNKQPICTGWDININIFLKDCDLGIQNFLCYTKRGFLLIKFGFWASANFLEQHSNIF